MNSLSTAAATISFVLDLFFLMLPLPPEYTLFPFTALFRSVLVLMLPLLVWLTPDLCLVLLLAVLLLLDRRRGSAGMPSPTPYAVFCWKKKKRTTPRFTTEPYHSSFRRSWGPRSRLLRSREQ